MIELGRSFADETVARLYRFRPPYPKAIFDILRRLLVVPRTVLDAGAGTGAIARELVPFASRVDALDPSIAMIHEGRRLPLGDDARLRWILGSAEDGEVDGPYGLITCGASLHWMQHDIVLPRFRALLASGARLAIVDTENVHPSSEVREAAIAVIKHYSPVEHHASTREMVDELVSSGRLALEGMESVSPVPFQQSVDDYLSATGSTASLNRGVLGARADDFAHDMRAAFARYGVTRVRFDVAGAVAWGRPT